MGSDNKKIVNSSLLLRIITLLALAASIVILVTNNITDDGVKTATFKDVKTYRYVLATACIGAAYTILQIPFAVYHACAQKRFIRNGCLPEFDFYGDHVISLLLGTGVGAGFGASYELKRLVNVLFDLTVLLEQALGQGIDESALDESRSKASDFFVRGSIATAVLCVGFICMAVLTVLSSINRQTKGIFG